MDTAPAVETLVTRAYGMIGRRGVSAAIAAAESALREAGYLAVGTGSCAPARAGAGVHVPRYCSGSASSAAYYGTTCWLTADEAREWAVASVAVSEALVRARGVESLDGLGGRARAVAQRERAKAEAARIAKLRAADVEQCLAAVKDALWRGAGRVATTLDRVPDNAHVVVDGANQAWLVERGWRVVGDAATTASLVPVAGPTRWAAEAIHGQSGYDYALAAVAADALREEARR